jgi:hypothetical protein
MDYIDIPSGGMRLFGDDLNFMQTGVKVALGATVKKLADSNGGWVILTGFNIATTSTPNEFSVSGGWACIDNEICYFAGDNVTFLGLIDWSTVHFESYVYDYPVGTRMMVNGNLYNPQKRKEVRLATTATGKTLANSNRYEYVLKALLDSLTVEQSNTITLAPNVSLQIPIVKLYKKDGRVYFTANLETDAALSYGTGSDLICTLPIGFRPDRIINIPVYNSSKTLSFISIANDGNVFFLNMDTANWVASSLVSIHNVSFDL